MDIKRLEQRGNVTQVWMDVTAGWEQWVMLSSDEHFDSTFCDRVKLKRDHELAKTRDAMILRFGDWYDAMQGKFDPRRSMDELRPEYRRSDYYDYVVHDSADWCTPYKDNLLLLGLGNHETGVVRHGNTNLTDRLVYEMRQRGANHIVPGSYGGWVKFLFNLSGGKGTGPRKSLNLYYYHGSGGSAPVTKGVIDTARQSAYLPDADVVVNGHNHNSYWLPIQRRRLSTKGVEYYDTCHFVRTPGYKMASDARMGFDVEQLPMPKPTGCVWMRMYCEAGDIKFEFTPAVG